jgi:hypothetical protein
MSSRALFLSVTLGIIAIFTAIQAGNAQFSRLGGGNVPEGVFAEDMARMRIEGVRARRSRIEGGDYDDKKDTISMRVKLTNQSMSEGYEGTGKLIVLGEHVKERNHYRVLLAEDFSFAVGAGRAEGRFEWESSTVTTAWDTTNLYFGEKYEGWIIILKNSNGEVIAFEATKQAWEKEDAIARAVDLREDDWVDRDIQPTEEAADYGE